MSSVAGAGGGGAAFDVAATWVKDCNTYTYGFEFWQLGVLILCICASIALMRWSARFKR